MRENLYQKYHKIANVSRVASTTYESIESSNMMKDVVAQSKKQL
jgi:hypothetical protein